MQQPSPVNSFSKLSNLGIKMSKAHVYVYAGYLVDTYSFYKPALQYTTYEFLEVTPG